MSRRFLETLEETFIAYLLMAMTIVTFSQVVVRYVFNAGAVWALELTVYLFAWLVLFGMSYGIKQGTHLGVDAFVNLFPRPVQRMLALVVVLACAAYAVILFSGAWTYWNKIYKINLATEDLYVPRVIVEALVAGEYEEISIPRWIPYSILPLGLALLFFRVLQAGWQVWTGKRDHISAAHEAEDLVHQQLEADAAAERAEAERAAKRHPHDGDPDGDPGGTAASGGTR